MSFNGGQNVIVPRKYKYNSFFIVHLKIKYKNV